MLNIDHSKRCIYALNKYYKIDGSPLSLMVRLRFILRELEQHEDELNFYNESWYDIRLRRPSVIEMYTAAHREDLNVDFETVKRAMIMREGTWNALYAAKKENTIHITDEEIRDLIDIPCWELIGMKKQRIEHLIKESKKILKEIPICGIRLFE